MSPAQLPFTGLPVEDAIPETLAALRDRHRAVLVAPPGAGKTTVVPLRLLQEEWLGHQRIVVLEPRRIAARAAAQRMAHLIGDRVGGTVGYRTGDDSKTGRTTRLEVITEGILIRMLQSDPSLDGIGAVVLDEVHERNLAADLSLALAVDAQGGLRRDLRLLAMSATLEAERFAAALGDDAGPAPVVRSDGRLHPVDLRHEPPGPRDRLDGHTARIVATALDRHRQGDVLVFVPGAADVRRVTDRLGAPGLLGASTDVYGLSGSMAPADQDSALRESPEGRRRVIVATDIAESSLTVAGVRIVVDAGLVRVPRLDPTSAMTRLQTEPASLASADQRAGRAGRLGPGVAYRLWDRSESSRRPRFAVPEIEVADLTGLALELAVWGARPDEVALIDQPPAVAWAQATAALRGLGAVDERGLPTPQGRAMADLPVHPRLAALAVRAREQGRGWTGAVLAAVLEERDVLRGHYDELPTDLAPRVELVGSRRASHPNADRNARSRARRRADQIARRLGAAVGAIDVDAIGALTAVAYPERIAQAGGGNGFRLRGGGGGQLRSSDPLATSSYLAVARVEAGRSGPAIALAAHLSAEEVQVLVANDLTERVTLRWDPDRNDARARREQISGALILSTADGLPSPGPATTALIVEQIRASGGSLLGWTAAARALQQRIAFLGSHDGEGWPDLRDAALLATLDEWFVPLAPGLRCRADVERVDLVAAMRLMVGRANGSAVDRLAPTSFSTPGGASLAISYEGGAPRASRRVQDLYGMTTHPRVLDGSVPVVLELLSPAQRPIQVTADLPGFWSGSWSEVRKEMAGRYPKHLWPQDPAQAKPPPRRRRR